MLFYSTRTAVFKNGDRSVLICRITLPSGVEESELCPSIPDFYSQIYDATCSAAREYAARILPSSGTLASFTVECERGMKGECLTVKRTYAVSCDGKIVKRAAFKDKFKIKCDKTKKNSIKERQ